MKCIKKIILISIVLFHNNFTHTTQSHLNVQNRVLNPDFLEKAFHRPNIFLLDKDQFTKKYKVPKEISKFLNNGKPIKGKIITEGQTLLFRKIFTELYSEHQGSQLPLVIYHNQNKYSYDAAFFSLPDKVKQFLISKKIVHVETETIPLFESIDEPPTYEASFDHSLIPYHQYQESLENSIMLNHHSSIISRMILQQASSDNPPRNPRTRTSHSHPQHQSLDDETVPHLIRRPHTRTSHSHAQHQSLEDARPHRRRHIERISSYQLRRDQQPGERIHRYLNP